MRFSERQKGQVTVLRLDGKIMGGPPTKALCNRIDELFKNNRLQLLLDFEKVQWINSAGIGTIVRCLNSIRSKGGDIRFANVHDSSARCFHITKIDTVVEMFGSVDEAIASFTGALHL